MKPSEFTHRRTAPHLLVYRTWVMWRRRRSLLALPCQHGVVFFSVIVGIEKLLKPLEKLKVVLELALHQLLDRDDLRDREEGGQGQCVEDVF